MSSAHAEMVLHYSEYREEQDSDNDTYRLLRHILNLLQLHDLILIIVTLLYPTVQYIKQKGQGLQR